MLTKIINGTTAKTGTNPVLILYGVSRFYSAMAITKIEIRDVGNFDIKHDYLHRGNYSRLETFDKGKYKKVQFDCYRNDLKNYPLHDGWQKGYDYEGNEIYIKITDEH